MFKLSSFSNIYYIGCHMRKKQIYVPNLKDIPFSGALDIAYASTPLTHSEIAERSGKGLETIRRYFKDPTYNPPVPFVPELCEIIGNNILIEWQVAQRCGHVFFSNQTPSDPGKDIRILIAELTKEFSDVLIEDTKAQLDNEYKDEELAVLDKEIEDLITKAEQLQHVILEVRKIKKGLPK